MATLRRAYRLVRDAIRPMVLVFPPNYPRLGGQHREYTLAQLRAFRKEQRVNDASLVMHTITSRMSEKEMQAVSEFISGLR